MMVAWQQGQTARQYGWERVSPYINVKAENFWLAGYDGIDFDSVVPQHKEKEQKRD